MCPFIFWTTLLLKAFSFGFLGSRQYPQRHCHHGPTMPSLSIKLSIGSLFSLPLLQFIFSSTVYSLKPASSLISIVGETVGETRFVMAFENDAVYTRTCVLHRHSLSILPPKYPPKQPHPSSPFLLPLSLLPNPTLQKRPTPQLRFPNNLPLQLCLPPPKSQQCRNRGNKIFPRQTGTYHLGCIHLNASESHTTFSLADL